MGEKDMYPKGKKQEYSRKLQVQSRHSQELRATSHSIRHSGRSRAELPRICGSFFRKCQKSLPHSSSRFSAIGGKTGIFNRFGACPAYIPFHYQE